MSLATEIDKARAEIMRNIGGAIDSIRTVAIEQEMKELAKNLLESKNNLASDKFNIIVLGRFKNGKSTFMNALLGKMTHAVSGLKPGQGAMPTNDLPTTATLTTIDYAETPSVKVLYTDDKSDSWSFEKYLRESTVKDDEEINENFFSKIGKFEMQLPAELCRSGVTMVDSPGLDDVPMRTMITMAAVKKADVAIVLYRSDILAGKSERDFVSEHVLESGTRVFTIINMWNGKQLDDRFKGFVWNRLVKDARGGPAFSGQEMQSHDIFPVDALQAEEGKLSGKQQFIEGSGMAEFESRLASFLINDRYKVHLTKHVTMADGLVASFQQKISQQKTALEQDEQKLQERYNTIQPQLEAIRKKRESLPHIFSHYRKEAQFEIRTSFEQFITKLKQALPDELAKRKLPGIDEKWTSIMTAPYRQKKICQDAIEACNSVIKTYLEEWSKPNSGAQKALEPIFTRLFEEIKEETDQIDNQYNAIHVKLTGWRPSDNNPEGLSTIQERVLSGAAGLLFGDPSVIFRAGGSGWRNAAGTIGGHLIASAFLSTIGLAGTVVFFPAALIAGIIAGFLVAGADIEERVKKKALEIVLPGLSDAPAKALPAIEAGIDKLFDELEANVMTLIISVIEEEENNINQMITYNKLERSEKQKRLNLLNNIDKHILVQRNLFKQAIYTAQQI